jgi:tRNA dimethylallyltransferase
MSANRRIIVIGGATASGKTKLAIDVAKKLGTEIINADSRQIYKELNIGVAKPTAIELNAIKHHFVSCTSIHEHFNAGDFQKQGQLILNQLLDNYGSAVICGGTGLYIKALLEGLDEFPETDEELRNSIELKFKEIGLWGLKEQLLTIDASAADFVKLDNPSRVKRALELVLLCGKPLSEIYKKTSTISSDAKVDFYCIDYPRETLYRRIDERVDKMVSDGLIDEVKELIPFQELKALQTVGYSELFESFNNLHSQEKAIEKIKQHTRNYAKRQITWFKNQFSSNWISPKQTIQSIFATQ